MTLHHLRELVNDDLMAVDDLIIENSQSSITLINNLTQHLIQSGGKRIRPLLVLLASRACNYQAQDHILLATLIEFFHTATLLHDDVIDESTLRRGRETANEIWGSKASILVGDYLLTCYMKLMIKIGDLKIMQVLAETAHQIGCGEIKQLMNRNNPTLSLEDYFDVIRAKTSLLFAASTQISAILSKTSPEIEASLYQYGLHLGNAFQLTDDALDYCSNAQTMGKNIGDDLANGKATMPLLYILQHGTPAQQQLIKDSLMQNSLDKLPAVLKAIEETGAIEYTQNFAKQEVKKAHQALVALEDSAYKEALFELANYAIIRNH
jgi:octaprenyl-diphosphate synthase